MANMPASVQTLLISAPVELGQSRANSSYLISCPKKISYVMEDCSRSRKQN